MSNGAIVHTCNTYICTIQLYSGYTFKNTSKPFRRNFLGLPWKGHSPAAASLKPSSSPRIESSPQGSPLAGSDGAPSIAHRRHSVPPRRRPAWKPETRAATAAAAVVESALEVAVHRSGKRSAAAAAARPGEIRRRHGKVSAKLARRKIRRRKREVDPAWHAAAAASRHAAAAASRHAEDRRGPVDADVEAFRRATVETVVEAAAAVEVVGASRAVEIIVRAVGHQRARVVVVGASYDETPVEAPLRRASFSRGREALAALDGLSFSAEAAG